MNRQKTLSDPSDLFSETPALVAFATDDEVPERFLRLAVVRIDPRSRARSCQRSMLVDLESRPTHQGRALAAGVALDELNAIVAHSVVVAWNAGDYHDAITWMCEASKTLSLDEGAVVDVSTLIRALQPASRCVGPGLEAGAAWAGLPTPGPDAVERARSTLEIYCRVTALLKPLGAAYAEAQKQRRCAVKSIGGKDGLPDRVAAALAMMGAEVTRRRGIGGH